MFLKCFGFLEKTNETKLTGKMTFNGEKPVEYLVVDTTAFIQNAPLQVNTYL